jgi:hypothetical protein
MNWQTYYKDAEGDWCESVLLKDMTLAEAEACVRLTMPGPVL